jgi:hypothetical protein
LVSHTITYTFHPEISAEAEETIVKEREHVFSLTYEMNLKIYIYILEIPLFSV